MAKRDPYADQSRDYWAEYSNLQRVKHSLIRTYLGGWYPKLGTWAGRVLYIDTHAGRGAHLAGNLGSPLVALTTFLGHQFRDRLLAKSEFRFVFIERDRDNHAALREELRTITLPNRVHVTPLQGECFAVLDQLASDLAQRGQRMAPAFIFVDPYGFKMPGAVLRKLFEAGRSELFINVIWRELDMAIAQARAGHAGLARTLDVLFDGDRWRGIAAAAFDARADQAADAFGSMVGARWQTYVRMLGDNGVTRYFLLHLTQHDAGRDLMKDSVWSICRDGQFYVRKNVDQAQQVLIEPEPNFGPLREWVREQLGTGSRRWSELETDIRPEMWRITHLSQVIRELRREGELEATDYEGRFSRAADPLLRWRRRRKWRSGRRNGQLDPSPSS